MCFYSFLLLVIEQSKLFFPPWSLLGQNDQILFSIPSTRELQLYWSLLSCLFDFCSCGDETGTPLWLRCSTTLCRHPTFVRGVMWNSTQKKTNAWNQLKTHTAASLQHTNNSFSTSILHLLPLLTDPWRDQRSAPCSHVPTIWWTWQKQPSIYE